MDCEFSEFSFGYAATREAEEFLIGQGQLRTNAPVLPNLVVENTVGYDVKITHSGYTIFMQFKRPEFVTRQHATSPTWLTAGAPHYRVAIDTASDQHQRLLQLQVQLAAGIHGPDATLVYLVPNFWRHDECDNRYLAHQVLDGCTQVPPHLIGDDGDQHYHVVAGAQRWILSKARDVGLSTTWTALRDEIASGLRRSGVRPRPLGPLAESLEALALQMGDPPVRLAHDRSPMSRLRDAAAGVGLGVAILPLSPRQ